MTAQKNFRVDSFVAGLGIKAPCVVATNANITLSGEQTVNGIAVVAGDRVLVKNQTDPVENGIYNVELSAWQRAGDWDGNRDVVRGTAVYAYDASAALRLYAVSAANPIEIGTTSTSIVERLAPDGEGYPPTQDEIDSGIVITDYRYEPWNVLRYGAVGDNTFDNTAVFQAVVDAALSLTLDFLNYPSGFRIYFPAGQYRLTSAITHFGVDEDFFKLHFHGDGEHSTVIHQATTTEDIFHFEQTGAGYNGWIIFSYMQLDYGRHAIFCDNYSYNYCQNVLFRRNGAAGTTGEASVYLDGNVVLSRFSMCNWLHGGDTLYCNNGNVRFDTCLIGEDVGNVQVIGSFMATNCQWVGNTVDQVTPAGIFSMGPAAISVTGGSQATFTACSIGAIVSGVTFLNSDNANAVEFHNCTMQLFDGTLVKVRRQFSQRGVTINGGYLRCTGTPADNILIDGDTTYVAQNCIVDKLRIGFDAASGLTIDDSFLDPQYKNYWGYNPLRQVP